VYQFYVVTAIELLCFVHSAVGASAVLTVDVKAHSVCALLSKPYRSTQWRSCLRHYATKQKVAGSIP